MSPRRTFEDPKVEARWLQIDALSARVFYGIDTTEPGWRDEYLEACRLADAEADEDARLIATPHVDEAIERMEEEFGGKAGADAE